MPPVTKRETPKKIEKQKEVGFLTEYLKGARKYIATGIGAMILLLSAEALAKGKPAQNAEDAFDELGKAVEKSKATAENVSEALKAFHTSLDILQANPSAKAKLKKALHETLGEIEADKELTESEKLEGKLEAIAKFRAYLGERLDAQASKARPEATPEAAPEVGATSAESGVKVELGKGAVAVEGETTLGTPDSYVRRGILKPDYAEKIPDSAKIGLGRTTFLSRLATLAMRMEAAKQAEAKGEKERAVSLRSAAEQQKKMLQKKYGDILQ